MRRIFQAFAAALALGFIAFLVVTSAPACDPPPAPVVTAPAPPTAPPVAASEPPPPIGIGALIPAGNTNRGNVNGVLPASKAGPIDDVILPATKAGPIPRRAVPVQQQATKP